jgi:hypothetical protein
MTVASQESVRGPAWSNHSFKVVQGRFPLAVERYIMAMVADLVPGVTTVTLNARYYSLHGYVAHLAARDDLTDSEAIIRLRRAEVVLGAISARHLEVSPATHRAYSQPHGYNRIVTDLRANGGVNVPALAQPGVYSKSRQGYMAAYRGSEILLRIVTDENRLRAGEHCDAVALTRALESLDPLLARNELSVEDLDEAHELCLCAMSTAQDGEWLSQLFAAPGAVSPRAQVRRQTLQMIRRVLDLTTIKDFRDDLSRYVCFDAEGYEDPVLSLLNVVPHWRGLMLRNESTTAWRRLWAWLVDEVGGLSTRAALAERLADQLPTGTVGAWRAQLPSTSDATGRPLDAEVTVEAQERTDVDRWLAVLALGAGRSQELTGREFEGFTARRDTDVYEELAPRWLAQQLDTWADRPLRDFGRHLTELLINRSQRLALVKARPNPRTGVLQVPTRLLTRDNYLFTQGAEGRGEASLRLAQLARITAGMGLLDGNGDTWKPGPRSHLLDD